MSDPINSVQPVSSLSESAPSTTWNDKLWEEAERLAAKLSGDQVVRALADASESVWGAGLDHAFAGLSLKEASAFDVSWLSVFIVNLSSAGSGSESGSTPDEVVYLIERSQPEGNFAAPKYLLPPRAGHSIPDEDAWTVDATTAWKFTSRKEANVCRESFDQRWNWVSCGHVAEHMFVSAASPGRPEELDVDWLVAWLKEEADESRNYAINRRSRRFSDDERAEARDQDNQMRWLATALPSLIDAQALCNRWIKGALVSALPPGSTAETFDPMQPEAWFTAQVRKALDLIDRTRLAEAQLTQALSRISDLTEQNTAMKAQIEVQARIHNDALGSLRSRIRKAQQDLDPGNDCYDSLEEAVAGIKKCMEDRRARIAELEVALASESEKALAGSDYRRVLEQTNFALRSSRDQSLKAIEELPGYSAEFPNWFATNGDCIERSAVLAILRGAE